MVKICIQGIKGSYSHEASLEVQKRLKTKFDICECLSFGEIFEKIKKYKLACVPIENTSAGSVLGVLDLIKENGCEILYEFNLKINHCLLSKKKQKIKKVYSHYQALAQTSNFLDKNKIETNVFSDTANAARYISEKDEDFIGSISSEVCAKLYGLKILKKNILNSQNNTTRFFLVKTKNSKFDFEKKLNKDKISLFFTTAHFPSALYKCLGGFATSGVNLTRLESRPDKKSNFTYNFFIDFLGNLNDKNIKKSLEEIRFFSAEIKILGNYESFK